MTTAKKKIPAGIVVTQSLMKDVRRYVKKQLCGLVLQAKYITKTFPEDGDTSEQKQLGSFFEYRLTGALPRNGKAPRPKYTKTAIKNFKKDPLRHPLTIEGMLEPYQLACRNADRVKQYFKIMKIKILEVGVHFQKGLKAGTIDIIATYKGRRIVIDVKYSGLLFDKWNELGWTWTDQQKKFHGTQALQYHDISSGLPFYFLVVSSTNDYDIAFFEIEFDDFSKEQHQIEVDETRKNVQFFIDFGFHAVPELVRCTHCAIREDCSSRMEAPVPKLIKLADEE